MAAQSHGTCWWIWRREETKLRGHLESFLGVDSSCWEEVASFIPRAVLSLVPSHTITRHTSFNSFLVVDSWFWEEVTTKGFKCDLLRRAKKKKDCTLYTGCAHSSMFPPYEVKGEVRLAPLPFPSSIPFPLEPKASKQRLSEKKPRQKEPHKLLGSQQSSKKLVSTGSTKSSQKTARHWQRKKRNKITCSFGS